MSKIKKLKINGVTYDLGGGSADHRELTNRDAANQHPMSAITGLQTALDSKGTYSKPSGGIPKTDLASAVQTSLGKADSALQEHQSLADYSTTAQMNAAISAHHDSTKQDIISDLATIRSGAALGATALQSVPNTYRTAAAQDVIDSDKLNAGEIKRDPDNNVYRIGASYISAFYDGNDDEISTTYARKTDLDDYVEIAQGVAHAGEFLVVGGNGNVTTMSLSAWQGGSY